MSYRARDTVKLIAMGIAIGERKLRSDEWEETLFTLSDESVYAYQAVACNIINRFHDRSFSCIPKPE